VAYENIFFDLAPGGSLAGADAIAFFSKSGLPSPVLAAVWNLADLTKDGALDREEFAIAMQLSRRARKGVALPAELPRSLVPQSKQLFYNVAATSLDQWAVFEESRSGGGGVSQQAVGVSLEDRKIVDPRVAAAATGVTASDVAGVAFSGGELKRGSASMMMPTFALPAATFDQRMALESELSAAVQRRGGGGVGGGGGVPSTPL
jgi:hypothetical protein